MAPPNPWKIVCVVLSYWIISISMVFANKYLVGDKTDDKDVTLFVAWVQCIVTVLFVGGIQIFQGIILYMKGKDWRPDLSYASLHNMLTCMRRIFIMTITFVSMLTFNNLCLKHVGIAFYQVARSMTLIFTVIFSVTLLHKNMSIKVFLCCVSVAAGFVLGIDQEKVAGTLSVYGVIFGVITSLFVALNGIFTKKSLDIVGHDSVRLTLYNNINASILFLPFVIGTGQLNQVIFSSMLTDYFFWMFLLATGCLSFAIAWISAVQIDMTSPVTHHISANTKAVLQTLMAVLYTHDHKQPLWWLSIVLVIGGALSYAIIKFSEEKNEKNKVPPDDEESSVYLLEEKKLKVPNHIA